MDKAKNCNFRNVARSSIFRQLSICILIFLPALFLQGCFTGIESTKKIKLSKTEEKDLAPRPEDKLLSSVKGTPHTDWESGKKFIVTGDRGNVLFDPRHVESGNYSIEKGDTLRFIKAGKSRLPDGNTSVSIEFQRGPDVFLYVPQAKNSEIIMSDEIPGLADPNEIDEIASILVGKTLWTRSPLWVDEKDQRIEGRKFDRVTIESVEAGSMIFPVKIGFITPEGTHARIYMSMGRNSANDSRSFASLFSMSDPKTNYPDISDQNWNAIKAGNVIQGMTKDECRLAKGNPIDVNEGTDYSHSHSIWTFSDGSMLHFVDGHLRGINTIAKDY